MAKKKNSEALFEVISRSKGDRATRGLAVPDWMRPPSEREGPPEAQDQPEAPEAGVDAPAEEPPELPKPPKPPAARKPKPERRPEPKPAGPKPSVWPIVAVEDGRVKISLNPLSSALVLGMLVLVMLGVFLIGWKAAPRQEVVSAAGMGVEHRPDVLGGQGRDRVRDRTQPEAPKHVVGKYYMIVYGLAGKSADDLKEARSIEKFCNDAGMPVTVYEMQGQYIIYGLTGFDAEDSIEATKYAVKMQQLGKRYKTEINGQEFKQTDPRGRWPWFLKFPGISR